MVATLLASVVATLCCGACTGSTDEPPASTGSAEPLSATAFRAAAAEIVERREKALQDGDRDAFPATVDDDELQFVATQSRLFDNLAAMPIDRGADRDAGQARRGRRGGRAAAPGRLHHEARRLRGAQRDSAAALHVPAGRRRGRPRQ
ncbi:hypothetical protein [Nocardioides sp. B-3]|uniref:hypothetical protein n=1 Tax=Nocardioides sp. B-3 TaxID=2895565 RepID=UPI00215223F4|nr:hypothetical protein [Nocardioides sp. B-3]UUZ59998.1 hypothetical protein LP418_02985 [Nocardioides sp. B-3]